jgi:hypothetical protein
LARDSIPRTLLEDDVFIVYLKTWQDIENIPNRYADLSQFFDEIQSRSNSGALSFDFSVNDTGVHKPKRIFIISLSDVAAWYGSDECIVAFISRQHSACQLTKTFNLQPSSTLLNASCNATVADALSLAFIRVGDSASVRCAVLCEIRSDSGCGRLR